MATQNSLSRESYSMDMSKMKILGDLSMSNYYYVIIGPLDNNPDLKKFFEINKDAYEFSQRDMRLLCSEAVLPASAYATAEVKDNYMGVTQQFAHTRMYTDIDFTFYIDRKYRANIFFETWMNYIGGGSKKAMGNMEPNYFRRMIYPSAYKVNNIEIQKFERNLSGTVLRYRLKNAFPKALTSTTVSYGPAELLKVTVTLGYDYYDVIRDVSGKTQQPSTDQFSFDNPDSLLNRAADTPLVDYERQGAAIAGLFGNQ